MNIITSTYAKTIGNRRVLAAIVSILALVNAQASPAFAASVALQASQTTVTQTDTTVSTDTTVEQPTVQDVLLSVCTENGYGQDCAKTLLGMLWNESSNISTAIGDGGKARGYFQIHYKLHKISIDCAEDLVCSANWTINYMEAHSYPKYVKYAVQCHNSCNVNNGYAAKAVRNGNYFWNKPLVITQAAPIEIVPTVLAMK